MLWLVVDLQVVVMNFSPAFFDLQLRLASRVADLTGCGLEHALLHYTNLYVRLGCGNTLDSSAPKWKTYVAGAARSTDVLAWTVAYWREVGGEHVRPHLDNREGCFGFTRLQAGLVQIHFVPGADVTGSPLAAEALPVRREELARLFADLPETTVIRGRSWLYNLQRYRSLFPQAYLDAAASVSTPWTRLPLWGQLLHSNGNLRESEAAHFLNRLSTATSLKDVAGCFKHSFLSPRSNASAFFSAAKPK